MIIFWRSSRWLSTLFVILVAGTLFTLQAQQESGGFPPGKRIYDTTCAGCHGLDGSGNERAPKISTNTRAQRLSDVQIVNIISNGVAGTGMPAFHSLTATQLHLLVSYLRFLQGTAERRSLPGSLSRGKEIFFGKGGCSACHSISGEGGFLGPDLSGYASEMSANAVREELLRQNRIASSNYRSAVVTTSDGNRIEGMVRNEDNFSVQLQMPDGIFHFFERSSLQKVEYSSRSIMPDDYGKRLSSRDLDDLVSFLMSIRTSAEKPRMTMEKNNAP